jgi:predicted nucleotide-binding protein (sugar kinase/HSP70/actin superfamily)
VARQRPMDRERGYVSLGEIGGEAWVTIAATLVMSRQ